MNKFAKKYYCPKCGEALLLGKATIAKRCIPCKQLYYDRFKWDGLIVFDIDKDIEDCEVVPAAPTEPSATEKGYARILYKCSIALCDAVHDAVQNWDQDRCVELMGAIGIEMRDILAAAPIEVRETPQSGEEVRDD